MTSHDPSGERPTSALRLSSDDFEVIFQVTKELHSLPAERLAQIGYSVGQGDELLAALRGVRIQAKDASIVEIDFADLDGKGAPPTTSGQSRADTNDGPTANVQLTIPRAMASKWQALTTAIVHTLGERELFLRTGYRVEEVQDSTRLLGALSRQ